MQIKAIAIASAFVLSTLSLATVSAQESDALVKVLETAASSELTGTVQIEEEKSESALAGAKIVLRGGGQDDGALITDAMQVCLSNGAMSACTSELPMVKIFRDGDKKLDSVTFSEKLVSVDTTANAILKAIDFKTLIEEVKSAGKVSETKTDGGTQYSVTLDNDYFKAEESEDGPQGMEAMRAKMLSESVMEGVLTATTNSGGELESLTLVSQYNDPMSVIAKAMKNGGGNKAINPEDLANNSTPGRKVTVTFKATGEDSAEAKAFATEAGKLLSK